MPGVVRLEGTVKDQKRGWDYLCGALVVLELGYMSKPMLCATGEMLKARTEPWEGGYMLDDGLG